MLFFHVVSINERGMNVLQFDSSHIIQNKASQAGSQSLNSEPSTDSPGVCPQTCSAGAYRVQPNLVPLKSWDETAVTFNPM